MIPRLAANAQALGLGLETLASYCASGVWIVARAPVRVLVPYGTAANDSFDSTL
jgi:hypothetical protein